MKMKYTKEKHAWMQNILPRQNEEKATQKIPSTPCVFKYEYLQVWLSHIHYLNNKCQFPNIQNVALIKSRQISHKMSIWKKLILYTNILITTFTIFSITDKTVDYINKDYNSQYILNQNTSWIFINTYIYIFKSLQITFVKCT